MASNDVEAFRQGLLNVFREMDNRGLSDASRDRLRAAFDHARTARPKEDAPLLTGQLQGFHDRIVSFLADADRELTPEQVGDLEALVREHLPNYW